jgi:hypothetical protein
MTQPDEPSAADVMRALKSRGGQACDRQTKVFLALWRARRADPNLEKLNQAALARALEMPRQAVNHAIRALRRKGLVEFTIVKVVARPAVVKERRVVELRLPDPDQLVLPFPRPAPGGARIGAAA